MYNSFDIAKKILDFANDEKRGVDTMKLLKLTYIAHGYYLGFFGEPLIKDEIQAWKYGPVIPILYHVIKRFGTGMVDSETLGLYTENDLTEKDGKFLKAVWSFYKDYSGLSLSSNTHEDDTPWAATYSISQMNKAIDNAVIEDYYRKLIGQRSVRTA